MTPAERARELRDLLVSAEVLANDVRIALDRTAPGTVTAEALLAARLDVTNAIAELRDVVREARAS